MKNSEDFFEKTGKFAEQAEAKIKDLFEKAQKSEAYAKITDAMEQVGEAVDKKIEEIKQGEFPGKVENLRDQAENKAETFVDHARAYGSILASDVDEVIDSLKEKLSGNSNKK
jgi:restriction endonuclease Mrr